MAMRVGVWSSTIRIFNFFTLSEAEDWVAVDASGAIRPRVYSDGAYNGPM
jgi:hypothetical protein